MSQTPEMLTLNPCVQQGFLYLIVATDLAKASGVTLQPTKSSVLQRTKMH
jgi:hypothetical protein